MKSLIRIAAVTLALGVMVPLESCGAASAVLGSFTTQTPDQVTTLAEADQAADLVVKYTKIAVDTGKLSTATLQQLQNDRAAVRAALDSLHTAQANGQSLSFATFNAALAAWNTYATNQGIQH